MLSPTKTLDLLSEAYGGLSQLPNAAIGQAIFGQVNNGALWPQCYPIRETIEEIARYIADYWQLSYKDVLMEIERSYLVKVLDFGVGQDLFLADWA